jgi:hypothetical protein
MLSVHLVDGVLLTVDLGLPAPAVRVLALLMGINNSGNENRNTGAIAMDRGERGPMYTSQINSSSRRASRSASYTHSRRTAQHHYVLTPTTRTS